MNIGTTRICKPHLVDFLRMCDKYRWCSPRIRYASIRSKPELCADIDNNFNVTGDRVLSISPKRPTPHFPELNYDLNSRKFLIDGIPHDFPRISREKPQFGLERRKVTLHFGCMYGLPGSGIISAFGLASPSPST